MKKCLLFASCITALAGCSGVSKEEHEALKSENERLLIEIEDLRYGAQKMLAEANYALESNDLTGAKTTAERLLQKHPSSDQADSAKKLVKKIDSLVSEKKMNEARDRAERERKEKEAIAIATSKMRSKYDEFNNITWYNDKSTPTSNASKNFGLYFGKSGNSKPVLRLKIRYTSDDWLFIEKYIIKTDNQTHTIIPEDRVERDHGYGEIWEWYDVPVDRQIYNIIKDLLASKSVKLRYSGEQYHSDRVITLKEINAIKNVLNAYQAMGGDFNF